MATESLLEGPVCRQMRRVHRQPLHALAVFQVPAVQNDQHSEGHILGCHAPNSYGHILGCIFWYPSVQKKCLEECLGLRKDPLVEPGCCLLVHNKLKSPTHKEINEHHP